MTTPRNPITRRGFLAGTAAAAAFGTAAAMGIRPARAQKAPLRVGAMFPMSGIGAEAGAAWLLGTQLAVDQWNRKGGVLGRQIELVVRDDKYSSAGAVTAGRELAGMGINLMVGASQSPMALGLAPLLADMNAVCVAPTPSAMSLTHENFTRNFFRLCPNASMLYGGLAQILVEKNPEVSNWATIVFDSEYGHDAVRYFEHGIRQAAGTREITFEDPIYVPVNKTDFRVEINQLMNSKAEGLYLGVIAAPAISFLQQARSVGLNRKLKVMGEAGTDLLIAKAMQKSTPDNLWSVSYWHPQHEPFASNAMSQQLYKDYVEKTGDKYPVGLLTSSHRSSLALFNGIEKAGDTDTQAVIAAMEGMTFDTIAGPYTIRKEDHQGHGHSVYAKVGPRDAEPFWGTNELAFLEDASVMEPATPGTPFKLPTS
ncbi:ABC transporter substrate-binding protein (plasmid) [Tistrella bauzanensis]|uniref:ABC transporter substrate-binding protein n=1 Tax=Tistrella TaxID=171436 RepID=UPI0031F608FF